MTDRIKVWPKPGLQLRHTTTHELYTPGMEVLESDRDVQRRLRDGDLLREEPTAETPDKEHAVEPTPEPAPKSDAGLESERG